MIDALVQGSIALTRWWVRRYTTGLPPDIAAARSAEIDSDMWEMRHDTEATQGISTAAGVLRRLVLGMPADLAWRFDNGTMSEQSITRRFVALAAAGVVAALLWSVPLLLKGRPQVMACADAAPITSDRAAARHQVIECAGAFFAKRR